MIPVRFQYIQTQYTNVKLLLFSTSNEHSKKNLENNWIHKIFKDHKNFRNKFYKRSARLIH